MKLCAWVIEELVELQLFFFVIKGQSIIGEFLKYNLTFCTHEM